MPLRSRAARVGRPLAWRSAGARAGMAAQAGEDRGAVRAGRQLRPARAPPRARARRHLRPAVLYREPRRLLRRHRRRPGREVAAPDGYTLVNAGSGPHLTGPAINPNIGYDPLKDFTHIAMVAADSYVLVANPALGAKSIADLVADRPRPAPDLVVAGRGLARPPDPRALQAQRQAQHPARAGAQFRHAGRARQSHQPDLHDAAHRRPADQGRAAGAARGHRDARAIRPIRTFATFAEQGFAGRARRYLVLARRARAGCRRSWCASSIRRRAASSRRRRCRRSSTSCRC